MTQSVEDRPGDGSAPGDATKATVDAREQASERIELARSKLDRVTGALNLLRRLGECSDSGGFHPTPSDLWAMFDLIGEEADAAQGDVIAAEAAMIASRRQTKEMKNAA